MLIPHLLTQAPYYEFCLVYYCLGPFLIGLNEMSPRYNRVIYAPWGWHDHYGKAVNIYNSEIQRNVKEMVALFDDA